jgi:prepilin-type N-terminal cleavage/methylation domain-containing protein
MTMNIDRSSQVAARSALAVAPADHRCRRGFTLIELVVVFVIIAVIVSIGLAVGPRVLANGKVRSTQNVLQILDQALTTYTQNKQAKPPAFYTDRDGNKFPIVDGVVSLSDPEVVPALALMLAEMEKDPQTRQLLASIPSQFTTRRSVVISGQTVNYAPPTTQGGVEASNALLVVLDAWGRPIRAVHPEFHGRFGLAGEPTRTVTTGTVPVSFIRDDAPADPPRGAISDGGLAPNQRPYFYSVGPDGDAGTREDNQYSQRPNFPARNVQALPPAQ